MVGRFVYSKYHRFSQNVRPIRLWLNVGISLKVLFIKGMLKSLLIRIVENGLCLFGGHRFYTFSQLDLLYL